MEKEKYDNLLKDGDDYITVTITDQEEWGIYFYIEQISLVSSF